MTELIMSVQTNSKGAPNFATAEVIDAVEVVRCKECKWRKACKVFSQQQITDDSYCSWGEREGE